MNETSIGAVIILTEEEAIFVRRYASYFNRDIKTAMLVALGHQTATLSKERKSFSDFMEQNN